MKVWTDEEKHRILVQDQYLYLTSTNLYCLQKLVHDYVKDKGNSSYYPIQDVILDMETDAQKGGFSGYTITTLSNDDKILGETLNARPLYGVHDDLTKIENDIQHGETSIIKERKETKLARINGKKAVAYTKKKQQQQQHQHQAQ